MTRRPVGLLVVAGLLGGGVLAAALAGGPAGATPRPAVGSEAAVVGAVAVCPDIVQNGTAVQTRVSLGVAPDPTTERGGRVEGQRLGAPGPAAPLPLDRPGQVVVGLAAGPAPADGYVVTARGPLAAGLEVEQVGRGDDGPLRGLAGLRCEAPRTESWFVGGSTLVGQQSVVVLANPDDAPATVDVEVFTSRGPADTRPGRGLLVAPHSRRLVALDTLAPDRDRLAVHVSALRGRVAAAVRHVRFDGRTPNGVEWVPQAQPPSTSVVVPGIAAVRRGPGSSPRTLLVTNPTADDTVVRLQLTTGDGQFVPTGLDAVPVPAGSTASVDLTRLVGASPAAVTVTSDGSPVLASALLDDVQDAPLREIAYAGSAPPLSGVAVLTDLVIDRPTESTLLLSAPQQDASVQVTPVQVVGNRQPLPAARTVAVAGGRTVALRLSTFLPPGATGRLAVEVRPVPGSGPVYAARYLRARGNRGPLTTSLTLQGAAQRVPRPQVLRDPGVSAGG